MYLLGVLTEQFYPCQKSKLNCAGHPCFSLRDKNLSIKHVFKYTKKKYLPPGATLMAWDGQAGRKPFGLPGGFLFYERIG